MSTRKKIGCGMLALVMWATLSLPANSYAAGYFYDISGHWAEFYIKKVDNANVISGYPDGRFLPDKAVTRAEFASMVNKAFELNRLGGAEPLSLSDVPYSAWFYNDVSIALAAGYAGGYNDNTFKPNNTISRQEAAVMLDRLIPEVEKGKKQKSSFSDSKSVAPWASKAVSKITAKGYLGAYSDNRLHPEDPLTRAQTAKILSEILDNEDIITRRTVVDEDKTTLANKIYVNKVLIDEDLEEGSATIDNCIILGDLAIEGGGTVTLNNTRAANATVGREEGRVRLVTKGDTVISKLEASDSSYIQTSGKDGLVIPDITINKSADVILKGTFSKVSIEGTRAMLTLESGKIADFTVTSSGKYSDITLSGKSEITQATVDVECYFHGQGTIAYMTVYADGVTYETKPGKMVVGLSVDRPQEEGDEKVAVTFKPRHKAENVDVDTAITLTFNTAMKLTGGKAITDSNIAGIVNLHKGSKNGDKVPFKGTINSAKKIITITPNEELSEGTRYYVVLADEVIQNGGGNKNDGDYIYFTTEGESEEENNNETPGTAPALGSLSLTSADSSITAAFKPNSSGTVYAMVSTSSSAPTTAQIISANKKTPAAANTSGTLAFTGLTSNTRYYVFAFLRNSSGTDSSIVSSSITTTISDAALSGLTLAPSGGSNLLTGFNAATKTYDIQVPSGTTAVDVTASVDSAANVNPAISINGTAATSKTGIPVAAGSTTAITVRIAADNKSPTEYVVNVTVAAE